MTAKIPAIPPMREHQKPAPPLKNLTDLRPAKQLADDLYEEARTSERALAASIRPLPENERPISEQFRIIAKEWADLDGAARMYEATRHDVLNQRMLALNAKSVSMAEMMVRASPEWHDFTAKMVEARTAANRKKLQLDYIQMRHREWIAADANARSERRL